MGRWKVVPWYEKLAPGPEADPPLPTAWVAGGTGKTWGINAEKRRACTFLPAKIRDWVLPTKNRGNPTDKNLIFLNFNSEFNEQEWKISTPSGPEIGPKTIQNLSIPGTTRSYTTLHHCPGEVRWSEPCPPMHSLGVRKPRAYLAHSLDMSLVAHQVSLYRGKRNGVEWASENSRRKKNDG